MLEKDKRPGHRSAKSSTRKSIRLPGGKDEVK